MTTRSALRIPTDAFVVLWEKLNLGSLPRALFVPSPGATADERAYVEHAAAVELARMGIGTGDSIDHDLVAALRLLAQPSLEYYGWIVPPGGSAFGVLAAASGQLAFLARLKDGTVDLARIAPGNLAAAVVGELPWVPPATDPVLLVERSHAAFERATGATVTGNGQFFVARRDRLGRRRQFPQTIEYVDTNDGRWLLRRLSSDGPTSASLGAVEVLAAELDEAARQLAASTPARSRTTR